MSPGYFHSVTSEFTGVAVQIEAPEEYTLTSADTDILLKAIGPIIGHCDSKILLSGTKLIPKQEDEETNGSFNDSFGIHLFLILSR